MESDEGILEKQPYCISTLCKSPEDGIMKYDKITEFDSITCGLIVYRKWQRVANRSCISFYAHSQNFKN